MSFFQQLLTSEKIVFCAYICIVGLTLIGVVVFGIIMSKISSRKFRKSCKIISDFANESGVINDVNLEQFEATCLDDKTNPAMLEGWETFKSARFGYPSEYIDKDKVLSRYCAKNFKKGVLITSLVLFAIAVVAGVYAIIVTRESNQFALLYAIVVMIFPLVIMPCYLPAKPYKKAEVTFDQTMDDLDTAVKLQNYVERKIDNNRLVDIQNRIKDVILSEQSKPIPTKKDQLERRKAAEEAAKKEEDLDDVRAELFDDEPVAAEPVEYEAVPTAPAAEVAAPEEETEPVAEEDAAPVEEETAQPAPVAEKKVIPFEPFSNVLNQVVESDYPTATLRKVANIIVLAFGKFKEPAQREALKGTIRRFIVSYKAAAAREAAEAQNEQQGYQSPSVREGAQNEEASENGTVQDDAERENEIAAMESNSGETNA